MITSGTILIAHNALRPSCIQVEDHTFPESWVSVAHNLPSNELEKQLTAVGWTFFYMANPITTTAFGFDRTKMMRTALQRAITSVRGQKCNCLEIDDVTTRKFLGIPYVSLSVHPRHIQKNGAFSGQ